VKIYRFNPETGVYLGEDFADETRQLGAFRIPYDATAIAPPHVDKEEIQVFDVREQRWETRKRLDP